VSNLNTGPNGACLQHALVRCSSFYSSHVDDTQSRDRSILKQRAIRGIGARQLRGPALKDGDSAKPN